ncbi:Sphingolipid ceramide N-deacylase [Labilithrix luteola]|uniref:Sphingolipid ceramide N-deacylase n=1 Tax=Labilithrix luteola TaxID=1391654 RepID=A0A0K1Q0A3_9BACT|nr:membrane dipeptidase [Labilithrix luteola]AKU99177.1 Sphingolipid ceramide N-deacylase [Labilithrix luteola]
MRRHGAIVVVLGGIAVGALTTDCGMQQLPPHHPIPVPSGEPIAFTCGTDPPSAKSNASLVTGDLAAWHREGEAFANGQPIHRHAVLAKDARAFWNPRQRGTFPYALKSSPKPDPYTPVPIGGSYWWGTDYPVVGRETLWVSSRFAEAPGVASFPSARGEAPMGAISITFPITTRALRVQVGGDDDPNVGLALLVEGDVAGCAKDPPPPALIDPAGFTTLFVRRGRGKESVEAYELPLEGQGCALQGRRAMVRIFDQSKTAHVNVGAIEPTDLPTNAPLARTPVWGYADLHTHPTSHIGFGGLQGIHTVWGSIGGPITEYNSIDRRQGTKNIARDMPPCDDPHKPFNGHHGGLAAPVMINMAEGHTSDDPADLADAKVADVHDNEGGPSFRDFPSFRSGAHQQYHVTQIHRAYLGGLRLVSALAVHNRGLEYGMGYVVCGSDGKPTVDTTADLDVVRAHVQVMRELETLNSDWMKIAYTPEDAREIIGQNKLAVVLGVEVAQLGQDLSQSVAKQVDELAGLGIRQVVLVHGMDNLLAGTALFQDLYNSVNDWLYRPAEDRDKVQPLSGITNAKYFGPASFFEIRTDRSPLYAGDTEDRILFRLGNPRRAVISNVFPHPDSRTYTAPFVDVPYGSLHPFVNTAPRLAAERGVYDGYPSGHRNKRGLTPRGKEFLERLVKRGMLVDFAHMSDETVSGALTALAGHRCDDYPFMISHAHFRHLPFTGDYSDRAHAFVESTSTHARRISQAAMNACVRDTENYDKCDKFVLEEARRARAQAPWFGPGSVSRGNLPREFDIATPEAVQLAKRRGSFGLFLGQGPLDEKKVGALLPFKNDCAGSSKSFAVALHFAAQTMPDRPVGIASDFSMIGNVPPRFGEYGCGAYLNAGVGSASGAQLLETLLNPEQYQFAKQEAPVAYTRGTKTCAVGEGKRMLNGVACGGNEPLVPAEMGERTFDFNVDGLAHFGLVPDMLQDVANVLRAGDGARVDDDLDRVFRSAEGFLETWEHARALVGCSQPANECVASTMPGQDPRWCGAACPMGWNRGAPLQSLKSLYGECELGKRIRLPLFDDTGKPLADNDPVYRQHGALPKEKISCDLPTQGDWALYKIGPRQVWTCGSSKFRVLDCPPGTTHVKVRRVLDATIGDVQDCHYLALPPEVGNRSVVFECLAGPIDNGDPVPEDHRSGPCK